MLASQLSARLRPLGLVAVIVALCVPLSAQVRVTPAPYIASTGVARGPIVTGGGLPTVANVGANSCGTSAATLAGNDNAGAVTVGATSGTQCRITFTVAAAARRHCVVVNEVTANLARAVYVTTTTTDLLGTFVAGDVLSYLCLAR